MSEVLEKIRQKYPTYADKSDEDLAIAIGGKYPQYMDADPAFKQEFETYTSRRSVSPDPLIKAPIPVGSSVTESTEAKYEEELNRVFKETAASDPGVIEGMAGSLESGVKSAQQIAPVIVGKELSRLKTSEGFDPPEGIKQQAFRDIYGNSFNEQVQKLDASTNPEEKADSLYFAYKQRVRDLTERRNAMLDVWTGVAEQLQKERQEIPKTQAQKELSDAVTQGDKWAVFKKYPVQVASSIVLESLPPSIAGAIIGSPGGPAGVAAGIGLGGASTEYANTILGEASKAGYDVSQEGQLTAFLDSPDYDAAADKALIRSGIIGVVDTATGSAAGLLIKPALKQGLKSTIAAAGKETALQAAGGATGELGAQLATRKPGEALDWFDISMEAVGEAVSAVPEAAVRMSSESIVAAKAAVNSSPATAVAVKETEEVLNPNAEKPVEGGVVSERPQEKVEEEVLAQAPPTPEPVEEVPLATTFKDSIDDFSKKTNEELMAYKGTAASGATGMAWDLGAQAKTAEDVAALRVIAEESAAKVKDLVANQDLEGAMAEAGRQPAEAYEFATGVKLDGTPKWQMFEKRIPGYKPSVPDQKWIDAHPNVLRGTVEPVPETPAPTPVVATSESGTTAPVTAGVEPPASPIVTQQEAQIKEGSEQPLTLPTDSDSILAALDRAIELTDIDPTKLQEGITGIPIWLAKGAANGALRIIRASYLGGKTIANAISDGVEWLRNQNLPNFNEVEAQSFLESAMAQRGAQTVQTDEERAQEELAVQSEETEPKQFAGYREAGQERPVENIDQVKAINRQRFFDPAGDIDQDKIDQAWFLATRLADPEQNESFNREIREASGRQIGPALLAHDLQHFAFRMVADGDLSLMHFLRDNWSTLATGGGLTTEAMGRGLRGLVTDRADAEVLDQLASVFDWRKAATQKSLGISDEEWASIKQILDGVQLTSSEVLDGMREAKTEGGKSAAQDIQEDVDNAKKPATPVSPEETPDDEESWQDRTARRVLDKMESSQTEWIQPDAPKNEVREYVKMALKDTTWPSVDSPDHTTRNVEAYLNKVTSELEVLGVSNEPGTSFASRLAWEIHRERLNRWSLKNLKARQKNSPNNIVQSFLSGLTSLKSPDSPSKVRSILNSARARKLTFNDTIQPDAWKGNLADSLVAEGVDHALAARVADELYIAKVPEFASRQAAIFQRAGESVSGIVRAIMQSLREQPYRAQNPEWRKRVAKDYFLSAGLSESRAEDAANVFDNVFVVRESDARAKAARQLLQTSPAKAPSQGRERAMEKLKDAVRIGLTDPNRTWEDSIAALNGWKGFTEQEHNDLADWIERLDGALPHEHAKLYTKINNLLASKLKPNLIHQLASFYSSNQLSGTGTQLLSYLNPAFASIVRSGTDVVRSIATGDFGRPLFSARALIEGMKTWSKEYSFAWKNDAYTSQSLKNVEKLENLHSLMTRGLAEFRDESLSPSKRGMGLVKYLSSYVDIVRKSLQSADQAWQSTIKEWQSLLGGRDLLMKAGLKADEINDLLFDSYSASEGYYHEAIAAGKEPLDALMHSRDKVWQDMEAMFKNRLGDTDGASILTTARLESELEVGNHRGEGGFLNDWLTGLQGMQSKHPLMYRLLVGFPRVNFNILSRAAWYSPWGFKRLAVDLKERRAGVSQAERSYKQSMATELQRRQRLAETITGTIATGIIFALYASQADKEDSEKLIWFDMEGPINPKEKSIWIKSGHRPNSIGIKVGDKRFTINWSRGGLEAIQVPIAMASAYEDRRLNSKDPSALEAAARLGSLLGFTSTGRRDYTTEKSIAYSAASKLAGFVPFAGTLRTINKLAETGDTTTIKGAIIAATPAAPAIFGKPALNVLGEPVTADMTGLKTQRLGVPINLNSPLPLYRLMADKGESPPQPRRDVVEKDLRRPVTDEEWYNYVETYGGHLKERMTESFGGLVEMPPEVFNKQLERFADQAKNKAMGRIRSGQ